MSRQLSDKDSLRDMETSHSGSNPSGVFYWLWIVNSEDYDFPQHFLNFLPLPHGQGSLRPVWAPLINRILLKTHLLDFLDLRELTSNFVKIRMGKNNLVLRYFKRNGCRPISWIM